MNNDKDEFNCCGGNDEKVRGHCTDCPVYIKNLVEQFNKDGKPVVGLPCTLYVGTDQYPCKLIQVKSTYLIFEMEYANNRWEKPRKATLRRDGSWREMGGRSKLVLGKAESYMDPHF